MFLNDPFTGESSIPFTLYAMECEGEFDEPEENDEDDEVSDD